MGKNIKNQDFRNRPKIDMLNQKGLKMGETPQYYPLPNIRVSGNFNNTSKQVNRHARNVEILILLVLAGLKNPKMKKI